jgi:cytochrome P450
VGNNVDRLISLIKISVYNGIFLCSRNGEEWYKYRAAILPLLRTSVVKAYANQHVQVARNFVDYIQMKMDETSSEIVTDICQHLLRFTIEGTS